MDICSGEEMSSIMVLVIGFGLGCITGFVVHVLLHNRRINDSARAAILDSARRQVAVGGASPSAWLIVGYRAVTGSGNHDRHAHKKHANASPGNERAKYPTRQA